MVRQNARALKILLRRSSAIRVNGWSCVLNRFSRRRLYTWCVGAKLSLTNRYLRDPELREKTVTRSVATSSAIEGIRAPFRHDGRSETNREQVLTRKKP